MFASFSKKFAYLCLRQVYGVFSPYLFPAFDHFGVLVSVKKQIGRQLFMHASVFLSMINFVITSSKFDCEVIRLRLVVPQPL